MLSILIPTYNHDITDLATGLQKQAAASGIDFEIVVMEDGSTREVEKNNAITTMANCRHIVLENNVGRSAIRNKLADLARFNHLLFIDCDAEINSANYITKYLAFCHKNNIVVGGTAYDPLEQNPQYSLRLTYGRKREARSAIERSKLLKDQNFATFNFLISKEIFNQVRFDESIRGYGHEDTLFGHQLRASGYQIIHIDNPLIHKGLDNNTDFIRKTEEGTRNLYLLYKTGNYPYLANESKLLKTFTKLQKTGLTRLLAFKYDLIRKALVQCLSTQHPSLLLYDTYKLLFLCKTSLQK